MLIGLTGKYCAGKNYIASILQERGLSVLDVDTLGHQALEMEKEAVLKQFGFDLRKPDGSLDRHLLGKKIFGNPQKLAILESIIHPIANRLTEDWIEGQSNKKMIINAALLHRSSVFKSLERIIIVKAPFFTRLFRAKRRDKLSWLAIFKRISSQKDFDTQYLTKNAEIYIVKNSCWGQRSVNHQIDAFLEGIK